MDQDGATGSAKLFDWEDPATWHSPEDQEGGESGTAYSAAGPADGKAAPDAQDAEVKYSYSHLFNFDFLNSYVTPFQFTVFSLLIFEAAHANCGGSGFAWRGEIIEPRAYCECLP